MATEVYVFLADDHGQGSVGHRPGAAESFLTQFNSVLPAKVKSPVVQTVADLAGRFDLIVELPNGEIPANQKDHVLKIIAPGKYEANQVASELEGAKAVLGVAVGKPKFSTLTM